MPVTIRKALLTLLKSSTPSSGEVSAVEQVSKQALDLFQQNIEDLAKEVADEAMKGNYYKLTAIDIKHGFDKWHEKRITGRLKLAIGD